MLLKDWHDRGYFGFFRFRADLRLNLEFQLVDGKKAYGEATHDSCEAGAG